MNETLQQQISGEIITLITIFAPLLTAIVAAFKLGIDKFLDAKIGAIKDDNLRQAVQSARSTIEDLITKEVTNADTTLKPVILAQIAKGTATKDDIDNLKNIVRENVLKQIPKDINDTIPNLTTDLNTYLNSTIETILGELKLNPTSPVSKTTIPDSSVEPTQADTAVQNSNDESIDTASQNSTQPLNDNSASAKVVVDNPEA